MFLVSGILKAQHPIKVARAIVEASLHFDDPAALARVSTGLGEAMKGLDVVAMPPTELLQTRESGPASLLRPKPVA